MFPGFERSPPVQVDDIGAVRTISEASEMVRGGCPGSNGRRQLMKCAALSGVLIW